MVAAICALLLSYVIENYLISPLPLLSRIVFTAIIESAAILLGISMCLALTRSRGKGESQMSRKEIIGLGMSVSALFALGIGFLQVSNQGVELTRVIFVLLPLRLLQGYFITAHSWEKIANNKYLSLPVISGVVSAALLQFLFDVATTGSIAFAGHIQILILLGGLLYAWMVLRKRPQQDGNA